MNREHRNARLVAQSRGASKLAGLAIIVIGSLVMLGWVFQIMPFKSILPGLPTMKFNTALSFVLLGAAVLLLPRRPRLTLALSALVAAFGLLTASQYLFGWNLSIDQLFVHDTGLSAQTTFPGRMSFITATNFFLTGSGLILVARFSRFGLGQSFALIAGLTGLLSLSGYLYQVNLLYQTVAFSSVALHTATAFILLSLGILFVQPENGLSSVITADHAGGVLARRLLPVAILFPLIFGWIRLQGQKIGFYDTQFGVALFALSSIVVFTILIFLVAQSLNRLDNERSQALEAVRQARDELEQRVQERTMELAQSNQALESSERTLRLLVNNVRDYAIYMLDREGNVVSWNAGAEHIKGYTESEIVGQHFSRFSTPEDIASGEPQRILQTAEREGHFVGEGWRMRKDGSRFWASIVISAIRDENNTLIGFSKVTHDLTERRERERQLLFQASLQQAVTDAVIASDLNFRIQSWNKAAERIYGWREEEVIGKSAQELLKTEFIFGQSREQILHQFNQQSYWTGEVLQHHKDGTPIHILGSTVALKDKSGSLLGIVAVNHDITERKQIEVALAEERNRLRTLIDTLPDYVYVKDTQSRFVLINNAVFANSGLSDPDQILGKTDFDFFPAEMAQGFYDDDQQVMTSGNALVSKEEPSLDPRNGQPLWFLTTKVPLRDEHGTITGLLGISRNITERKHIEVTLAEERNRLRVLIDTLPDYIYVKDAQHRFLLSNIAHARARGYEKPEQLIGKTDYDFFPRVMAETFQAEENEIFRTGQALLDHEQPSRGYKGGFIWALSNKVPLRNLNGELIGLVGITRDITERKQVENMFRALLESAPDAMIIADTEGRITLVNSQAEQLFGYSKSELVGESVEILMPEVFRSAHIEYRMEYVREAIPRAMRTGQDLYAMRKDGTDFPVEISLSPIETDGRTLIASAIRDISLHKQAAQALDEARMRAEEANKLKSEFLATMSHELRTPLNAIIGFSDVMLNNLAGELNDSQREYTQIILNNGEHLLSLINNLLDISKIEAGQFELHHTRVNLRLLLDDLHRNLQALADDKGLSLLTYMDPTMPRTVVGDEMRLKQILINLVGNAIKFTEAGHVEVRIMKGETPWWVISVRDTGIGIPAEALGYIFERFRQVDNSSTRQYEGTGLGLAIVRRLSELMGGSITVQSEVHEGSTFIITLPLVTELS